MAGQQCQSEVGKANTESIEQNLRREIDLLWPSGRTDCAALEAQLFAAGPHYRSIPTSLRTVPRLLVLGKKRKTKKIRHVKRT